MKIALIRNLLFLFLLIFTLHIEAKSWCNSNELNVTEITICDSEELRELDYQLNVIYGGSKASIHDYEQINWLKNIRDSCYSDKDCISNEYRSRIANLVERLNPIDPMNARPWCVASRLNITEKTICYTSSLRDLDAQLQVAYGQVRSSLSDKEQMYWLRKERDSCGQDMSCIAQKYESRLFEIREKLNRDNHTVTTTRDCSQDRINELKAVCVISAVGEHACSSTLYDHLPRGGISNAGASATCSAAASHIIDGSIDPRSVGLSMASGFLSGAGDSLLDSDNVINNFIGVVFKIGSTVITLGSLGQCFTNAERFCYK